MNERIFKKVDNGTFYIIGFIIAFLLFYLLQMLVMLVSIDLIEINQPGFGEQFYEANGNIELMTNLMFGVQNISQFVGEIILAIIMIIFLRKEFIKSFKDFKENLWYNILSIILGFIVIYLLSYGLMILYDIFGIQGTSENQQLIEASITSSSGIFMILAVAFLAPFVEEILFRKLLYGVIEEKFKMHKVVAVLISAIIFSALHAFDIFFFQYFAMALVLCGSYALYKNNILIPMGIHFLNNLSVFLIFLKVI